MKHCSFLPYSSDEVRFPSRFAVLSAVYIPMKPLHSWSLSPDEAIKVQAELRSRLILSWDDRQVETIGGVDVDLEEDVARAAIVILRLSDLKPIEGVTADAPLVFPYIPGLLAFREGPAVLAAWEKCSTSPMW